MSEKIYPADWAVMLIDYAGKPYRPCNGTEGAIFMENWCANCARDKAQRDGMFLLDECDESDLCYIIGLTFAYDIDSPYYPAEWQYAKDGQPCCTAFVPAGQPIPAPRCKNTLDLFDETKHASDA